MESMIRKVVSVMGPNNYQINLLGIFSGNDPVKNCTKEFTETCVLSVMLVVTMVFFSKSLHFKFQNHYII